MSISRRVGQRGLTLIELIIFIVIVSVALVGVLSVLNIAVQHSADPVVRKKMLAIAESLLEEVSMHPFTFCEPSDPAVTTASSTAGCATVEVLGAEIGETRGHATNPFNNVSDYYSAGGLTVSTGLDGSALPAGYSAKIELSSAALNGINATPPASPATGTVLLVKVTVSYGTSESLELEGYRVQHSPNSP